MQARLPKRIRAPFQRAQVRPPPPGPGRGAAARHLFRQHVPRSPHLRAWDPRRQSGRAVSSRPDLPGGRNVSRSGLGSPRRGAVDLAGRGTAENGRDPRGHLRHPGPAPHQPVRRRLGRILLLRRARQHFRSERAAAGRDVGVERGRRQLAGILGRIPPGAGAPPAPRAKVYESGTLQTGRLPRRQPALGRDHGQENADGRRPRPGTNILRSHRLGNRELEGSPVAQFQSREAPVGGHAGRRTLSQRM
mmetsp:Transcript_23566/g.53772  ORF Transcript_23566/g.53772 Transcript_23566/m.53772 type:complete len:248 (+) Transcript_23566:939-1682(+)